VGPFNSAILMGSRKVEAIRWALLNWGVRMVVELGPSVWTSDGPEGGSHQVGPFNWAILMGSLKVEAIRWALSTEQS